MSNLPIKHHQTAGCFLVRIQDNQPQILLQFKKWSDGTSGWVPTKGHIEAGETKEQTALRETREETGYVNMHIVKFLKEVQIEYPWSDGFLHQKTISWYLAELDDDTHQEPQYDGDERLNTITQEWFDLETAKDKITFPDERAVLELVIAHYRK